MTPLITKRPVTVAVTFAVIVILGVVSFTQLPIELLPPFEIPLVYVVFTSDESNPLILENGFVKDIEKLILSSIGVKKVATDIRSGYVVMTIELERSIRVKTFLINLDDHVRNVLSQQAFPIQYQLYDFDPAQIPIAEVIVKSELPGVALREVIEKQIIPRLEQIDGVGEVRLESGQREGLQLSVDALRLQSRKLTFAQFASVVQRALSGSVTALGRLFEGDTILPVRLAFEEVTEETIGSIPLHLSDNQIAPVESLVDIQKEFIGKESRTRVDGKRCVYIGIYKRSEADMLQVSRKIKLMTSTLSADLNQYASEQSRISLSVTFDTTDKLLDSIKSLLTANGFGLLVIALILGYLLRSIKVPIALSLIVGVILCALFSAMFYFNLSLNMLSLGGLSIALSFIVAEAVLILESCFHQIQRDVQQNRQELIQQGISDVRTTLIITTLCLLIIFIPVAFWQDTFFAVLKIPMLIICIALFLSVPISLIGIPLIFRQTSVSQRTKKSGRMNRFLRNRYMKLLMRSIRWRWQVLMLMMIALGALAVPVMISLQRNSIQSEREIDRISGTFRTFNELDINATESLAAQVETELAKNKEFESIHTTVYPGTFTINAHIKKAYADKTHAAQLRAKFPEITATVRGLFLEQPKTSSISGMGSQFYNTFFEIRGYNGDSLDTLIARITEAFKTYPMRFPGVEENECITLHLDPGLLSRRNLEIFDIQAAFLSQQTHGIPITTLKRLGYDQEFPVQLCAMNQNSDPETDASIEQLLIGDSTIPITALGALRRETMFALISRENGVRRFLLPVEFPQLESVRTAEQFIRKRGVARFFEFVNRVIASVAAPPGVSIKIIDQELEAEKEAHVSRITLLKILGAIFALLLMVLVSSYESFTTPVIITISIPFSLISGLSGLALLSKPLNEVSYLGLYLLAGISFGNNLFFAHLLQRSRIADGSLTAPVLRIARRTIRPVLLTSLGSICAVIPLAFWTSVWQPLAIAVISGLLGSMLITLFFMPISFFCASDVKQIRSFLRQRKLEKELDMTRLQPSVEIRHVSKIYPDGTRAVEDVSFSVEGGVFGLLGPNGAGKTTLMRMMVGALKPSTGVIQIGGYEQQTHSELVHRMIGYLPQEFDFYESFTARQLINFYLLLNKVFSPKQRAQRIEELLTLVGLTEAKDRKVKSFSGGMKRRMGVALSLLRSPPILIVDEPTAGLDPESRVKFRNLIMENSRKCTIILSTHIVEDIDRTCSHLAIMFKGKIVFLGKRETLLAVAEGKVWDVTLDELDLQALPKTVRITSKRRVPEGIKCRVLAEEKPHINAEPVQPSLEDAYILTIQRVKEGG